MRPRNMSGTQAKDYYYGTDPKFATPGQSNSLWHGKVADDFGLSGSVSKEDFLNIIAGNDIAGRQIVADGRDKNGEAKHRACIDIPFSPPKSLSIMALHAGDERLIDAHQKAVEKTIEYIEQHYVCARPTINGVTHETQTGNGLFATFTHSTSRENDPQLHTHTLLMNMTESVNGWQATHNDKIFNEQKLLNSVYQSELSIRVKELGYAIKTHKDGKWEIAGVKNKWLKTFSKRTEEIDKTEADLTKQPNETDDQLRNRAVLASRPDKETDITFDQLQDRWESEASRKSIVKNVETAKANAPKGVQKLDAQSYIRLSYQAIHEQESTFKRSHLINLALEIGRSHVTVNDLEKAFYRANRSGEIRFIETGDSQDHIFTSEGMAATEKFVIDSFYQGKDAGFSVLEKETVSQYLQNEFSFFTDGQKAAVENILTNQDKYVVIQGDAGTGKTSALDAIGKIVSNENAGIEIKGLGFTGKAAKEIEEKTGIQSQTLTRFLNRAEDTIKKPQLWLVDESSMVGSRQMAGIINRADDNDIKVIFIGDGKQLQAINAGRMFKDLQEKADVYPVKMSEPLRQKNSEIAGVVRSIKDFQENKNPSGIDDAFNALELSGNIKTIEDRFDPETKTVDKSDRINAVTDHVLAQENTKEILIVTATNDDRIALNETIKGRLQKSGRLPEKDFEVTIKTPVSLIGTDRFFASNYKSGQSAFVNSRNDKDALRGFSAGQEVLITHTDEIRNTLMVHTEKGNSAEIDLLKDGGRLSVYEETTRRFCEDVRVVFLKNDRLLNVQNGLTGTIEKISPDREFTVLIDGQDRTVTFTPDQYRYIDLGYAVTIHKSQGQTTKDVILMADARAEHMNTTENFYVAMSRAEQSGRIYTNNAAALKGQYKIGQEKTSTIAKAYEQKKEKAL